MNRYRERLSERELERERDGYDCKVFPVIDVSLFTTRKEEAKS